MIVLSDHSQSQVEREIDLFKAFDGFGLEPPAPSRVRRDSEPREIAVCPLLALGAASTCSTASGAPS